MNYLDAHRQAQKNGSLGYIDPDSGLFVMTEQTLRARKRCCGNGCRHCPFGRSLPGGTKKEENIVFLPKGIDSIPQGAVFLFWSGGKDSYLAFLTLCEEEENIVLCTTFANGMVGHQEIPIETIIRQAEHLQRPLILISLQSHQSYEYQVERGIAPYHPKKLAFGDLHLEGIRSWREKYFSSYLLLFPVWGIPYDELIDNLSHAQGRVFISAIGDLMPDNCDLKVGEEFTAARYRSLKQYGIDLFGENGEFHTELRFWDDDSDAIW